MEEKTRTSYHVVGVNALGNACVSECVYETNGTQNNQNEQYWNKNEDACENRSVKQKKRWQNAVDESERECELEKRNNKKNNNEPTK